MVARIMINHWLKKRQTKCNRLIKLGSVVRDVQTGTLMTVVSISVNGSIFGVYNEYLCQWFVGNQLQSGIFGDNAIVLEHQ